MTSGIQVQRLSANGIEHEVATMGAGPPVLLLHGFPHTWFLWRKVMPALAERHLVIAPDLRGLGGTTRATGGFDLLTLAADQAALLAALGVGPDRPVVAVGIDLGAPVAFALAMKHRARVEKLVLMESLLGRLPGAESFLKNGPPWWFTFHMIPELPETLVNGHEGPYLDYFLRNGTAGGRGIDPKARDRFVCAYTGREALRCAFDHYRALPGNGRLIAEMVTNGRVKTPTLAIAGGVVGDALEQQLRPVADDLRGTTIADCAHLIPEEQPEALATALLEFL